MIVLRVPATLSHREVATRVVSAACKIATSSEPVERQAEFHEEVVSACGEAFNNVVIHAYRGVSAGLVTLEIDTGPQGIAIRLLDEGKSFDPTSVPAPELAELPESGMGLFIIRSFMDDVRYEAGPPNVLTLTKRL